MKMVHVTGEQGRMTQADRAWALVCQYVQDAGLRRHMRSVGVAMRFMPTNWVKMRIIGKQSAEFTILIGRFIRI